VDWGSEYTKSRAELLLWQKEPPASGLMRELAHRAKERYEEMVQCKLIQPLLAWALSSADPVIRCAGVELATVCQLLHHMGPLLLTQQVRDYDRALSGRIEPLPPETLSQYLALTARLGNLIRDLDHWRRR
jgi:hypothetical protein